MLDRLLVRMGIAGAALGVSCSHDWSAYAPAGLATSTSTASTGSAAGGSGTAGGGSTVESSSTTGAGGHGGVGMQEIPPDGGAGGAPPVLSGYTSSVLEDAPIAYWRLGDAAGSVARDEIGSHDGRVVGAVTFGVPGAIAGDTDTAAEMDGATGHIVLERAFGFAGAAAFTVELWLKPSRLDSTFRRIFSYETVDPNGRQGYLMYAQGATEPFPIAFERWCDDAKIGVSSLTSLDRTRFSHMVARFDGSAMALYINGVLAESTPCQLALVDQGGPFVWGAFSATGESPLGGVYDELAIYDKALSESRISAHYAAGTRGP